MAKSTGIVLTATGISFGNEWLANDTINLRIPVAGLALTALFAGIEKLSPPAGVGLAWIMLVTVFVTPFQGQTPLQTLAMAANDAKHPIKKGK